MNRLSAPLLLLRDRFNDRLDDDDRRGREGPASMLVRWSVAGDTGGCLSIISIIYLRINYGNVVDAARRPSPRRVPSPHRKWQLGPGIHGS